MILSSILIITINISAIDLVEFQKIKAQIKEKGNLDNKRHVLKRKTKKSDAKVVIPQAPALNTMISVRD